MPVIINANSSLFLSNAKLLRQATCYEENTSIEDLLYQSNKGLEQFRGVSMTGKLLSDWYKFRAKEIERSSHFVDVALDLLKLGRERNIPVSKIEVIYH